jgi:hypothetical protein
MSWRPSIDPSIRTDTFSSLGVALMGAYDEAYKTYPLRRHDWAYLSRAYVVERKGCAVVDPVSRQRLPSRYDGIALGEAEIDFIDTIENYSHPRVALLLGPRGAGKTSLLHYVEEVLTRCNPGRPTVLVIVDGLELAGENGASAQDIAEDYAQVIHAEIVRRGRDLPTKFIQGFQRAAAVLERKFDEPTSREAFRTLSDFLGPDYRNSIIIAFDNLDHVHPSYAALALNLCRQIAMATDFACFACMRQNVADGVFKSDGARAFKPFRIAVNAPDVTAWLRHMGRRLAEDFARRAATPDARSSLTVDDVTLNPDAVEAAVNKLVDILGHRHSQRAAPQDDVVSILEAIAADDTRHMQVLIRRMLLNVRLPSRYLLGLDESASFHPIGALLESGRNIFSHDRYVPNLLLFEGTSGNPDFLAFHRVLCLLDRRGDTTVAELEMWMSLFGFSAAAVLDILSELAGPLLIRCSDSDVFDIHRPPEGVSLTDAGFYYRNHLLRNADYLTSVVLDVPLEHRALRDLLNNDPDRVRSGHFFAPRVASLLEYTNLVIERETRQVFGTLRDAPPSTELRRVADALRAGGLLTRSLIHALAAIVERSRHSAALRSIVAEIESKLPVLEHRCQRIEQRLLELVNRGRPRPAPITSLTIPSGSSGIEVVVQSRGDELEAVARLSMPARGVVSIVSMQIDTDGWHVLQSAIALPDTGLANPRSGIRPAQATFILSDAENALLKTLTHGGARFHQLNLPNPTSRTLFLEPRRGPEGVQLCLCRFANGARPEELGPVVVDTKLKTLSKDILDRINGHDNRNPLAEHHICEAGEELAELMLDDKGANNLVASLAEHDRVIIYAPKQDFVVPWEWLCPPPLADECPHTLAYRCETARWLGSMLYAGGAIAQGVTPRPVASLRTIGLGADPGKPWRVKTPASPQALREISEGADIIHLIGHWEDSNQSEKQIKVGIEGEEPLWLNRQTIKLYSLGRDGGSLILSVCLQGQLGHQSSLAIANAEAKDKNVAVWAPLTTIEVGVADRLDQDLRAYIDQAQQPTPADRGHPSLGAFFRNQRQKHPWMHVYVRYGL